MAYKIKINSVSQNQDKVAIQYQIFNDTDVLVADAQVFQFDGSVAPTLSELKAQMFSQARKLQNAETVSNSLQGYVGQTIPID